MARIVEEMVIVKVSKIVRDEEDISTFVSDEFVAGIEAMASELIQDPKAVVEVIKADVA